MAGDNAKFGSEPSQPRLDAVSISAVLEDG